MGKDGGMTVWNLGSINVDHVYRVPHLPKAGETLAALSYGMGLGGKGANQSVAAARAGADTRHIGAVGPGSDWVLDAMRAYGVGMGEVQICDVPTGHAIINVDPTGENAILLFPGANRAIDLGRLRAALAGAAPGDTLLLQNETSGQVEAAQAATHLRVIYSAAPFDADAVQAILPHIDLLVMNEGEAAELGAALGKMPAVAMLVTQGARGATWHLVGEPAIHAPAFPVQAVDTTGAGDCFIGTLAAGLDAGLAPEAAMRRASAAAALQVTRAGAAAAMPSAVEVDAFLAKADGKS